MYNTICYIVKYMLLWNVNINYNIVTNTNFLTIESYGKMAVETGFFYNLN